VRIANDSEYGLGGSVWTSGAGHGTDVARRIQTGTIGVNQYLPDPAAPFGGVKGSGLGRELGPEGLTAYQQLQSIYLPGPDPGLTRPRGAPGRRDTASGRSGTLITG
jgi:aldehyde dehydrogenase (NAD+)